MVFLIKAAQLILSLSILIALHEFGHYITARLFKTRVEKFFLFFDPWFSIFQKKIGHTTWGIGWLPLGGYVKISGMIDESMDKEQMKKEPQPWEFRSKPAWQRLIIMLGGVTVNFILGFFIFMMVMFIWGTDYLPNENVKYGVALADSSLHEAGFTEGDKIISIGGQKPRDLNEAGKRLIIDGARSVVVERNSETVAFELPEDIGQQLMASKTKKIFAARFPTVVEGFPKEKTEAQKVGFQKGDSLVSIDGQEATFFYDFTQILSRKKGEEVMVGFYRNGQKDSLSVAVSDKGKIGFSAQTPPAFLDYRHVEFSFFEAIPAGFNKTINTITSYVKSLSLIFTKEGASQLGGFGTIGGMFAPVWDWHSFWLLTGLLSLILAVMNLLPIPALDGGHVMFLLYEIITGRQPPEKFMEYAQVVGLILVLGLVLFANFNDIMSLF